MAIDMEELTLEEAMVLVKENKLDDPRLNAFVSEIDKIATMALGDKPVSYLSGAVSLCVAVALAQLAVDEDGDPDAFGILTAMKLIDNEDFQKIMIVAFKIAVGLTIKEGLK